jgi:hypothetical protein
MYCDTPDFYLIKFLRHRFLSFAAVLCDITPYEEKKYLIRDKINLINENQ